MTKVLMVQNCQSVKSVWRWNPNSLKRRFITYNRTCEINIFSINVLLNHPVRINEWCGVRTIDSHFPSWSIMTIELSIWAAMKTPIECWWKKRMNRNTHELQKMKRERFSSRKSNDSAYSPFWQISLPQVCVKPLVIALNVSNEVSLFTRSGSTPSNQ